MDLLMKMHKICLLVIFVTFVVNAAQVKTQQKICGQIPTKGFTVPSGDIILNYGDSLNITCNLYQELVESENESPSSKLYFTRNDNSIPQEMIEVLNSTSIRLHVEAPAKTDNDNYYCMYGNYKNHNDEYVCMNVVVVGVPPQEVEDFSCISRNYENLTCSWTPPNNYAKTVYKLSYTLKKKAQREQSDIYDEFYLAKLSKKKKHNKKAVNIPYFCDTVNVENGQLSCFWNLSTSPPYRLVYETYYFTLQITNPLGVRTLNYTFEHYKRVLANPPVNLTAFATSPNSIHLAWEIPQAMIFFTPGLHHRILYQCEYYEKKWQFGGIITDARRNASIEFDLTGLKYAHSLCDIRIAIRSAAANEDDDSMWSDNSTITVRTLSKIPDRPPETTLGSFQVINNSYKRDVYVYWKQIGEEQKNGQNFRYVVEIDRYPSISPVEYTNTYVKFNDLRSIQYSVNIWSQNAEGRSLEKSTAVIPAESVDQPLNFVKVAHSDNSYELSWEPPKSRVDITNYTIFMCSSERDRRPYQCAGYLDWVTVPKNALQREQLHMNGTYQFAIAANSHGGSSGMLWADCTIIANMDEGKLSSVWINRVGSDFIEVIWEMKCSDHIHKVEGFVISYCQIAKASEKCIDEERNQTIYGDKSTTMGNVTGLKPYTTYQLYVRVKVNSTVYSAPSKIMRNTTSEAAPSSPPRNVRVYNITDSSVSLSWDPPSKINGQLKYYKIYYNNETTEVIPEVHNLTLNNLQSYVQYTVGIEACTVHCSKIFKEVIVTNMSVPGQISKPMVDDWNDSVITIKWSEPNPPRGKVDYYQLRFSEKLAAENQTTDPIINITNIRKYTLNCDFKTTSSPSFVSVRAINIINGEHKMGPWSEHMQTYPYCSPSSSFVYIILGISLIFVAVVFTIGAKRAFTWVNTMKQVEVKLPPGLQPVVDQSWLSDKHSEDNDRNSGADQILLLDKCSGNESGISSGHESITSSVESDARTAASDSGNEQPSSLNDKDRRHSLRQRNIANKGYVVADAIPANWGEKNSPPADNYCMLGVPSFNQPEPDSPYMAVSDSSSTISPIYISNLPLQPPPYTPSDDLVKTVNPGYIPFSVTEPAEKSTGYVVAGVPNNLLGPNLLQTKPIPEEPTLYVRHGDNMTNLRNNPFHWQQSSLDNSTPRTGYVSVGDAPGPKTVMDVPKGYVPHRQFEAKSLKED